MAGDGQPEAQEVVLYDAPRAAWLRFRQPHAVVAAHDLSDVLPAMEQVDAEVRGGLWAAGFVAYEAAPAFDSCLCVQSPGELPLLWFGLFDPPEALTRLPTPAWTAGSPPNWVRPLSREAYAQAITAVRAHIAEGDTYQVNYTLRLRAAWPDDPWMLFGRLSRGQPTAHRAWVDTGRWAVGSVSPELFFDWRDGRIVSRPMKGTRPRGLWPEADHAQAAALHASAKDRAENVMIVDMVRNDLGRIAAPGSVRVDRLFEVEPYPTVWQMTSTVSAAAAVGGAAPIFSALFPAASITGAPKCAAMRIIAGLEHAPRGVYTGAVGYVAPGAKACFNVAIRTFVADRENCALEYGVGGGIVWDSTAEGEYEECETKARVLTQPTWDAALLETLRWDPDGGFALLERHLARLAASAERFGRRIDVDAIRARLRRAAGDWGATPQRVRLVVSPEGDVEIAAAPLLPLPAPYRVALARDPVDESAILLYHKTTQRGLYEAALRSQPDCADVLLWNRRGEVTETCIANVLFARDGAWWTPPVSCGLLAGTYRDELLARGEVREGVLRVEEVVAGLRMDLVNAVRGRWTAEVVVP